jgi:hypothetical protein
MENKSRLLKILNEIIDENMLPSGDFPRGFFEKVGKGSGLNPATVKLVMRRKRRNPQTSTTEALLVYFNRMPKMRKKKE